MATYNVSDFAASVAHSLDQILGGSRNSVTQQMLKRQSVLRQAGTANPDELSKAYLATAAMLPQAAKSWLSANQPRKLSPYGVARKLSKAGIIMLIGDENQVSRLKTQDSYRLLIKMLFDAFFWNLLYEKQPLAERRDRYHGAFANYYREIEQLHALENKGEDFIQTMLSWPRTSKRSKPLPN